MATSMASYEFEQGVAEALKQFAANPEPAMAESLAPRVLRCISLYGITPYPWQHLKTLLLFLAMQQIDGFAKRAPLSDANTRAMMESRELVATTLPKLPSAPFTIQRFCEILLQPEKFYGSNAAKLAYALEKLLRVTGSTPDLAPSEFRKRLEELHHERRVMEETTTADPKGPIALDVDLRPVATMMGQLGLGGALGGVPPIPVKNPAIEEGWTTRVAQSTQQQQQQPAGAAVAEDAAAPSTNTAMDLSE